MNFEPARIDLFLGDSNDETTLVSLDFSDQMHWFTPGTKKSNARVAEIREEFLRRLEPSVGDLWGLPKKQAVVLAERLLGDVHRSMIAERFYDA